MPSFTLYFDCLPLREIYGLAAKDAPCWHAARACATYLALPFSLHPSFVVLQFATLFALSVADMDGTFKKYL
ncbi:DUF4400 domain-containing protein [Marinobacterium aestuariivivens]|uniref:DUF4400 domain-containing protein n=1 Tax=Marinobacterium aestuariivivens TaxID=1698799 RepID=A0ABW2A0A1_9GAMM